MRGNGERECCEQRGPIVWHMFRREGGRGEPGPDATQSSAAGQARPDQARPDQPSLFTHLLFVCFEYCGSTGTRAVRVNEEVCGMAGARRRDRMATAVMAAWLGSGQGQNYPSPSGTQPQHRDNLSLHWRVLGILLLLVVASVDVHN